MLPRTAHQAIHSSSNSFIMKLVFTSTMAAAMLSLSSAKRISSKQKQAASSALLLDKLPDTGEAWMTLGDSADGMHMQAQPASNMNPLAQEHWRRLTWGSNGKDDAAEFVTIFQDGTETYYDEYAQAWRALGFYIDCDADQAQDRRLEDGDEQGHCQRYMLWAAVRKSVVLLCVCVCLVSGVLTLPFIYLYFYSMSTRPTRDTESASTSTMIARATNGRAMPATRRETRIDASRWTVI
jgi:Na+(H+)/acetate symporter ActP